VSGKSLANSIVDPSLNSVKEEADPETRLEESNLETQMLQEQLRSLKQDIDERKKYAHRIFCLMCSWLGVAFLILILNGFQHLTSFYLTQPVLLALIGGTTADVLGIFYIVTHYLFPHSHSDDKATSKKKTITTTKRVDSN
jgi:hypothetical protein